MVNLEKSELDPKQVFDLVGYQINLKGGKVRPTLECLHSLAFSNFYRRIKRKVGCSLRGIHCKGHLVPSRKQVTYKLSGSKGGLSGPKGVPRPLSKHDSNTTVVDYINKEGDTRSSFGKMITKSWSDLDLTFDLAVVTLSLKILSRLYLGNRKV